MVIALVEDIKNKKLNLLISDDYGHFDHYYADIVLNRGLHGQERMYRTREPYTKLLLGHQFVSLRAEFMVWKDWPRKVSTLGTNILVTLGGADNSELLTKVVDAITELGETFQTKIILGQASKLKEGECINTVYLINTRNMAALMAWADIGICGGGVTLAEMAFMGLPSISLKTAPNQYSVHKYAGEYGATVFLGTAIEVMADQIALALRALSKDKVKRQEIAVDRNPDAYGFSFADESHNLCVKDEKSILKLAGEKKIKGITSLISEVPLPTIGAVSRQLGLPCISQ